MTSVENVAVTHRVSSLRKTHARIKFLSVEPLLGPIPRLPLAGMHWVIVGGESGPKARPMTKEWVLRLRDRCVARGVPFFFKQWGGVNKKRTGRLLDGRTWDEMPALVSKRHLHDRTSAARCANARTPRAHYRRLLAGSVSTNCRPPVPTPYRRRNIRKCWQKVPY